MQLLSKKKRTVIISITSLIDVVLLLLIFFMLTTTFSEQPGMELELPETEGFSNVEVEELEVTIDKTGKIQVNGKDVSIEELTSSLSEIAKQDSSQSISLKADRSTDYGVVIEAMDMIKQSGLEKIVITTEKK